MISKVGGNNTLSLVWAEGNLGIKMNQVIRTVGSTAQPLDLDEERKAM